MGSHLTRWTAAVDMVTVDAHTTTDPPIVEVEAGVGILPPVTAAQEASLVAIGSR